MLDLSHIEKYKENNRIEAKKALGGLPDSIWETYSAFANTLGGIILLGVEEYPDKSLHPVDLPDPDWIAADLWETINDPQRVSLNILREQDVQIRVIEGKRIIVVTVPRAQRYDIPVYVGEDPFVGTYKRTGEGDYRCEPEEVLAMRQKSAVRTKDMRVLEHFGLDALDFESISSFRLRMSLTRPGHRLGNLETDDFLEQVGVAGRGRDGFLRPTEAGLLMFGYVQDIRREFPAFSLEYRNKYHPARSFSTETKDLNLYEFYIRVCEHIAHDISEIPEDGGNILRGDTPVHAALREALANCLIHADHHSRSGILIVRRKHEIVFCNPGTFPQDRESVRRGNSPPHNIVLSRLFHLIGIGVRIGEGIPAIFRVWAEQGWETPVIAESFDPDRITLSLSTDELDRTTEITESRHGAIIEFLTDQVTATAEDFAVLLDLKISQIHRLLASLESDGIITQENGIYRLAR